MASYNSVSPGWVDNMKLSTLNAALKVNGTSTSTMQAVDIEKFWSTPARTWDSDTHEVMEVTLTNVRLVNHIKIDVVKFPHDVALECFDLDVGDWVPLRLADTPGDQPCGHEVLECVPPVLPAPSNLPDKHHPQHSFSGHWESCEWVCRPVRFQRVRVILKRHGRSRLPCNSLGRQIAFSLAVRNFYCGYKIYSRDCVPRPEPVLTSVTEHQEFTQSTDVFGSAVSYSIRINRAENILRNDPTALTNASQTLIWRSEPHPFPWAVVNYFMDVRDANGDPQVLDRFYIDPLNEGPNVNLYYSNDEPEEDFQALDTPLSGQVAVINGQPSGPALSSDIQPYGRTVYVDIDNTPVAFVPGRNWWFGGHLRWKFMRSIDLLDHPIFDCGEFHLAWTRSGMRFASIHGDYFYVDVDNFQPATDFQFVCWYDGSQAWLRIRVNGLDYYGNRTLTVPLTTATVTKLRMGGFIGANSGLSADFNLRHLVIKVDESLTDDTIEDFFDNPDRYCKKSEFTHDDDGRTNNAVLRYHPDFVTSDFPAGFRGGSPTRYSAMNWSPIARDYRLAKGYLQFPPTKAKYWKFEFCDLVPESYEVYVPIKKTVKTYRTEMWSVPIVTTSYSMSLSISSSLNVSVRLPGLSASISVASQFSYRDSHAAQGSGTQVSISGTSATMVRVVTNQAAVSVLSSVSWAWNFMTIHKITYVPRFETTCVHSYDYIDVEQTSKIAYFVGLKYVQPYRVDYLAIEDTAQYTELFQDTRNIDSDSGFVLTQDHSLSSGDTRFAQAQSRVMPSSRVVRAVQFATTQSAPMQLLPDDDFDDPDHTNWDSVGDGALAPFTQDDVGVGSVLRVDRSSRNPSWSDLEATTWSTYDTINTWLSMENLGNPAQAQGGIESIAVDTPPGGRIYAAARAVAPADLASPLYVQIVDDVTGRVLSESAAEVKANQIVEWHTSYTVGEGGDVLAWRWRDFSTNPAYASFVDSFSRANATTLGTMTTGQGWLNGGTSHAIAALIAVTTVAGAYDYVDGITPWGTLEIVVGTMGGTGQTYAQLFDLDPVYLDDQGIFSFKGGPSTLPTTSVLNRAVQANDDIRIDILPTALVPTNRRAADWVDNVSAPYSLVVYLNGVWIKTIGHRLGARTLRGILGRLNQQFKSFSWLPASYGPLPGPVMRLLPVTGNGTWDANRYTWVDNDNVTWTAIGSWDNSTVPGTLVATAAGSKMVMDTRYWYGALSAQVHHVANGDSGAPANHGFVLVLDDDAGVYLDYAGNLVQQTNPAVAPVGYGNLIPGGVPNNAHVSVQFLDTKSVAASVRGSIDPVAFPRMLVARVNGAVVGALGNAFVQTWQGTRRGLAGDAFVGTPGNLLANPTFETNASSWFAVGGTVARSTAQFHSGVASLLFTPDGTTNNGRPENSDKFAVVPGASYSFGSWVRASAAFSSVAIRVNWFDAQGNFLSLSAGTITPLTANTWTNLTLTAVAPAGAATASLNPFATTAVAPAATLFYVDDVSVNGNIATYNAAFQSFAWAPDASNVVLDPRTPKWDEISQKATGTYESLAHFLTLRTGKLKARVVQRSPSIDIWDMDTLSMFADPIVWSFSNDGGVTFWNCYDIRNDPNGVLVFPDGVTITSGNSSAGSYNPGRALVWRVVSYAPNSKISSLTIRPWYGGLLSGITSRSGVANGGPNVMPYDHYPPISEDARFQTWSDPIPQDWYYHFRILARSKDQVLPPPKVLLASDTLHSKYKDEV